SFWENTLSADAFIFLKILSPKASPAARAAPCKAASFPLSDALRGWRGQAPRQPGQVRKEAAVTSLAWVVVQPLTLPHSLSFDPPQQISSSSVRLLHSAVSETASSSRNPRSGGLQRPARQ